MSKDSLRQVAHLLKRPCSNDKLISNYQIDSRFLEKGDLFFALPGERTDGHLFLEEASRKGAIGAVVLDSYTGNDFGLELIRVKDVLKELQTLAQIKTRESSATLIGITGSMGKTTTKETLSTILSGKFKVGKSFASYNTQATVPLTILNQRQDLSIWVIEMGMGKPGDLTKLVEIAPPHLSVVTKVAMAHYGHYFPEGVEGVKKAKGEIFQSSRLNTAIFDHEIGYKTNASKELTFSIQNPEANYYYSDGFIWVNGKKQAPLELPFPQKHIQHNLVCACSIAHQFGMSWKEIQDQFQNLKLPKMRFEQFQMQGVHCINDAFNANPESMMAALRSLPKGKGKVIGVLGRMVDLGPFSNQKHREVGEVAAQYCDVVLSLGAEALALQNSFKESGKLGIHFQSLEALKRELLSFVKPGDVLFVKGSRDLSMEKLFEGWPCLST
jgi:UDP-N-acetylmuramoyl-tripeptide--D-alanyl-D-alanine ligase